MSGSYRARRKERWTVGVTSCSSGSRLIETSSSHSLTGRSGGREDSPGTHQRYGGDTSVESVLQKGN